MAPALEGLQGHSGLLGLLADEGGRLDIVLEGERHLGSVPGVETAVGAGADQDGEGVGLRRPMGP